MRLLRVTSIQRGCVYDGPGVRTTVFMKGCSLQCPWCCNPETISYDESWFINDEKCLLNKNIISILCKQCERTGGRGSIYECKFGVTEKVSDDYSSEELLEVILRDELLYQQTKGGVTFSGGEPLLQAMDLKLLLIALKKNNIHIAFETTLIAPIAYLEAILPYIDYFIVDIKIQPQMFLHNDHYLQQMKRRTLLLKDKEIVNRIVFVDEMTRELSSVSEKLKELDIKKLEVLMCHNLGEKKYRKLNKPFVNYSASINKCFEFTEYLRKSGINCNILSN